MKERRDLLEQGYRGSAFMKQAAEEWNALSENERTRYKQLASQTRLQEDEEDEFDDVVRIQRRYDRAKKLIKSAGPPSAPTNYLLKFQSDYYKENVGLKAADSVWVRRKFYELPAEEQQARMQEFENAKLEHSEKVREWEERVAGDEQLTKAVAYVKENQQEARFSKLVVRARTLIRDHPTPLVRSLQDALDVAKETRMKVLEMKAAIEEAKQSLEVTPGQRKNLSVAVGELGKLMARERTKLEKDTSRISKRAKESVEMIDDSFSSQWELLNKCVGIEAECIHERAMKRLAGV